MRREKASLPVYVRRSKTSLLKFPTNGWREATTGNASVSAGYALMGSPITSVN